jgi:thioredoxin-like negative regulator of GroEL
MKRLDEGSFERFIEQGNTIVEFTADWCPDCRRIEPDLPEIDQRFAEQFQFGIIHVDEVAEIAERYQVKGIPSFLVFKDGIEIDRLPSRFAKTKEQIIDFIESVASK